MIEGLMIEGLMIEGLMIEGLMRLMRLMRLMIEGLRAQSVNLSICQSFNLSILQ